MISALAVYRERHPGRVDPIRELVQVACNRFVQRSVAGIHQPVQLAVGNLTVSSTRTSSAAGDASNRTRRNPVEMTVLDLRDGRCTDFRTASNVDLAPAAADADGTKSGAYALVVHATKNARRRLAQAYLRGYRQLGRVGAFRGKAEPQAAFASDFGSRTMIGMVRSVFVS